MNLGIYQLTTPTGKHKIRLLESITTEAPFKVQYRIMMAKGTWSELRTAQGRALTDYQWVCDKALWDDLRSLGRPANSIIREWARGMSLVEYRDTHKQLLEGMRA